MSEMAMFRQSSAMERELMVIAAHFADVCAQREQCCQRYSEACSAVCLKTKPNRNYQRHSREEHQDCS